MNKPEHHFFENGVSHNVSGIKISSIKEMAMLSAKIKDAASLTWCVPSLAKKRQYYARC